MKFRTNAIGLRTLPLLLAGSLASAGLIVSAPEGGTYAQAAPASPIERKVTRTVDSGSESVIARSTFWNGDCSARAVTITIKQPPANGNVSVRDGLNPVVENPQFGTAGRCVGKEVMGKQIVYRSKPDFHGSDVVVYESLSDKGEKTSTTVSIEVR
jgi:hypothetical protein